MRQRSVHTHTRRHARTHTHTQNDRTIEAARVIPVPQMGQHEVLVRIHSSFAATLQQYITEPNQCVVDAVPRIDDRLVHKPRWYRPDRCLETHTEGVTHTHTRKGKGGERKTQRERERERERERMP